jgi:REP element-mobilizing transposase RayT
MSSYVSRKATRLPGYDYSQAGGYFVTLCVEARQCIFGTVEDGEMRLNPLGRMIHEVWGGLASHYSLIAMDEFIVMPDHLHGIVFLTGDETGKRPDGAIDLPTLIRNFKNFTVREQRKGVQQERWTAVPLGLWQRDYHDHVIRNERDLAAIREYIASNPMRWHLEREYRAT